MNLLKLCIFFIVFEFMYLLNLVCLLYTHYCESSESLEGDCGIYVLLYLFSIFEFMYLLFLTIKIYYYSRHIISIMIHI